MRRLIGLGIVVAGGISLASPPAYGCSYTGPTTATAETRTYRHSQPSLAFEIPANYRAMGTRLGTVEFHDPATFAYIQCEVRRNPFPQLPQGTTLRVYPATAAPSLLGLVQRHQPWLVLHQPRHEPISLGEQQALISRYTHHISGAEIISLAFLSQTDNALVVLEAPASTPVIPLVLETLKF